VAAAGQPSPQADITYNSQSTYILPVAGKKDAFIFLDDRWMPKNPIDGGYVWLPLHFGGGQLLLT
jgi:hypothetical protein